MIQCPKCRAVHALNTMFCSDCGEFLGGERRMAPTIPSTAPGMGNASFAEYEAPKRVIDTDDGVSRGVTLLIGETAQLIAVELKRDVLLGRLDPANNNYPDIDLTQYGGADLGVSRRHARMFCRGSEVMLEDLGSVNGSFINGKPLTPYLAHPLRPVDVIRLGRMSIKIVF